MSNTDSQYQDVMKKVEEGSFTNNLQSEEPHLKDFYKIKDRLNIIDGLLMYTFEINTLKICHTKSVTTSNHTKATFCKPGVNINDAPGTTICLLTWN